MRTQIVVPCFEESSRFDRDAYVRFLQEHLDVGLVLVNDGSPDNTLAVLESVRDAVPERAKVLNLPQNLGKAEAVRQGMLQCIDDDAEYIGYWDADLATPLDAVPLFIDVLDQRADVDLVLGARVALLGRRIERKASRHYPGRLFATAASLTLNLPIYDTQCGAKLMRNKPLLRELFGQPFRSRWIFDVELIARYLSTGGRAEGLYELPVPRWTDVGESKVKPSDFVRAVGELAQTYQTYPLQQPFRGTVLAVTNVFSRYALSGAVGTALHYALLIVMVELLSAKAEVGAVTGASVGAIANYALNYHVTFASRASHGRTFPRFAVVALLGVVASGVGVKLASDAGFSYLLAQLGCTVFVLLVGFLLNRHWTFSS